MAKRRPQKGIDRRLYRGRRRRKRNIWLFLGSLFFMWMAYLFIGGDYGLLRVISLKRQELELRARLLRAKARKEILLSETKRLKKDPKTIEKIAREELGMIGEGEIRYQFPKDFGEGSKSSPKTP